MNELSRRAFVGVAAAAGTTTLAGCSGASPAGQTNGSSSTPVVSETPSPTAEPLDRPLSCAQTEADALFRVLPLGSHVIVDSDVRDPTGVKAELIETLGSEYESQISVEPLENRHGQEAVSLAPGIRRADSLKSALDSLHGIDTIRNGQPLPTVRSATDGIASQLQQQGDESTAEMHHVRPDEPHAIRSTVEISGIADPTILAGTESFALRGTNGSQTETMAAGDDIIGVGTRRTRGFFEVVLWFSPAGQRKLRRALETLGLLSNPTADADPLHMYDDDVLLVDGRLVEGLATRIKTGEWSGKLSVSVPDTESLQQVLAAVSVVPLTTASMLDVTPCDRMSTNK